MAIIDAWMQYPYAPPPLIVRHLDQLTARGMGIRAGGAMLARPDGALAGVVAAWHHCRAGLADSNQIGPHRHWSSQRRTGSPGQLPRCCVSSLSPEEQQNSQIRTAAHTP